jgi:type II secretory pathway predicted ATPase ExeA
MDLDFWGFRRWPFERSFAADRFFSSPIHEEAMARLLFLVEEFRRTGIVIGAAGTGKTYLLKLFQQRSERSGRLTVRCDATGLDGHELVGQVANGCLAACDSDASSARIWNALQARFAALALIQQPVVMIFDHFDLVEFSCQQSVCRLRQLADAIGLKLTIILATSNRVISSALQDLIELRIDLVPWTIAETKEFITTAIAQTGVSHEIFTDGAIHSIHDFTGGVPANIVSLCNLSLYAAMGGDEQIVTRELIEAAVGEMPARTGNRLGRQREPTIDPVLELKV